MDGGSLTALEIDPELEPEPEPLPESDTKPSTSLPEFGSMTSDDYQNNRKRRVSTGIEELLFVNENMQKFLEYVQAHKVIVGVEKIMELFEGQCSEVGCDGMWKVVVEYYNH